MNKKNPNDIIIGGNEAPPKRRDTLRQPITNKSAILNGPVGPKSGIESVAGKSVGKKDKTAGVQRDPTQPSDRKLTFFEAAMIGDAKQRGSWFC